ncbi:MAG: Hsp20/alpha crystallin family protein [Acidobacteriia bacterium]|nr:Hsp20/alpha crystallin family protein [Terriglobia bacterium]
MSTEERCAIAIRENWFEDLIELRRGFDQLFNRLLTGWPAVTEPERSPFALVPPAEVDKEAKKYHLRLALPGVDPSTVELKVLGNLLTISAERKASREAKDVDYPYRELSYGTLSRTLTFPEGLDTEKINAEYNNGLLDITAPVAAAALPRLVEIKGLPKAKAA